MEYKPTHEVYEIKTIADIYKIATFENLPYLMADIENSIKSGLQLDQAMNDGKSLIYHTIIWKDDGITEVPKITVNCDTGTLEFGIVRKEHSEIEWDETNEHQSVALYKGNQYIVTYGYDEFEPTITKYIEMDGGLWQDVYSEKLVDDYFKTIKHQANDFILKDNGQMG